MNRTDERFSLVSEAQLQSIMSIINRFSDELREVINAFINFSLDTQRFVDLAEQFKELNELGEDPFETEPLQLPASLPALPMKHQVLNRKPMRAVARSSC
ncbi:hypothetical protein ABIE27_004066 [Paenibacillus sp. 4624]|uniref:hypothetical protein n=1 Tax=Paenibacillus sp. 4624 TaxID=3156453 RepID=UPI003D2327B9